MKRIQLFLVVICINCSFLLAQLSGSAWPMINHDLKHSSNSELDGPNGFELNWRVHLNNRYGGGLAVGKNNQIYILTDSVTGNSTQTHIGYIYSINKNGGIDWTYIFNDGWGGIGNHPAIDQNDVIYVHLNGNEANLAAPEKVYAISSTGNQLWRYTPGSAVFVGGISSVGVLPSGDIIFGSMGTVAIMLNNGSVTGAINSPTTSSISGIPRYYQDGSFILERKIFSSAGVVIDSTPCWYKSTKIDNNETAFCSAVEGKPASTNGNIVLSYDRVTGDKIIKNWGEEGVWHSKVMAVTDSYIIVLRNNNNDEHWLTYLSKDGLVISDFKFPNDFEWYTNSNVVVDKNNVAYIGANSSSSQKTKVYSISSSGSLISEFEFPDNTLHPTISLTIGEDSTIYVSLSTKTFGINTYIYSLNSLSIPLAPTLSLPSNNATDQPISLALSWMKTKGASSYDLQVSTSSDFSTMVYNQSGLTDTSQSISGISNLTKFYWRVRAANFIGTSPWSSVWNFITVIDTPAIPTLSSPSNNATDVSITPTLSWNAASGASSYTLQVSTASDFSTTVYNQSGLAGSSRGITGLNNSTQYYWRVNATNVGGTSSWSSVWSFTTALPPQLVSPFDNASGISALPTLIWNTVTGASSYQLQISTSSVFSSTVYNQTGITDTSQVVNNLINSTRHYWRVRAIIGSDTSSWSTVWDFRTIPQAPILVTPVDLSTGIPTTTSLRWNVVPGASNNDDYRIQVSTVSNFSSLFVDVTKGWAESDSSYTVIGMVNNTQYFWRVAYVDWPSDTSDWSSVWNYTTILPSPQLVSPSNNATDLSITPTLSWSAAAGASSYTLQVSTASDFSSTVYNQNGLTGTSQGITGLSNSTQYYWRVNATNAGGTSSWSSAWDFTTIIDTASVPTLSSPSNNATDVSITPTLSWNTASGASSYTLQVSTASDFSSTVYNQSGLTGTSQGITGISNSTQYYWRVNATNVGGTSSWSSVWDFTTIIDTASVPTLSSPSDNATNVSITPTLSWNAASGATSYTLQVSTASDFSSTVYNQSGLTSTSQGITGLSNSTQYFWRVNATNTGGTSSWSSVWDFTTIIDTASVPALSSPSNNVTTVSITPTLSWNAASGATSYTLQVSTASDFSSTVYNQSGLTGISEGITGLSNSTQYYWRVNATNAGGTSSWSSVWDFTTIIDTASVPTLSSPSNNATDVSITPTLSWNVASGASSYTLQVSTASDFSSTVYNQSGLTSISVGITGLSNSTQYYWRVNATNTGGTSSWSSVWDFTTIIDTASVPTLSSPSDNATDVSITPTLSWNVASGASSYTLQVSTASDFSSTVYNQSGLTSISEGITGLSNSTKYYWRVNATNTGGTSSWSSVWDFTIIIDTASVPTLSSPSDNATDVSITPTLSWNVASGASSFTLQVSTASDFSSTVYNQSGLTDTSQGITGLSNSTQYYWRVNATNVGGTSSWSSVWDFITVIDTPSVPTLLSPTDSATNVSITPTLSWNAASGASSYSIQVSTASDFSNTVYFLSAITNTSQDIFGLNNSTQYYWRANAANPGGTSGWSTAWNFTTVIDTPTVPILISPSNNATDVSITPVLSWKAASRASSYFLQVSTTSDFSSLIVDSNITDTLFSIDSLTNNTSYYWRLRGSNIGGTSNWSPTWIFQTIVSIPSQITFLNPITDSIINSDSLILMWHKNDSDVVENYLLEYSEDSSFTNAISDSAINGTDTSKIITGLEDGKTYWLRVTAGNNAGWGQVSEPFIFRVDLPSVAVLPNDYSITFKSPTLLNSTISYSIPRASYVSLIIYNIKGKLSEVLIKGRKDAGVHNVQFNLKSPGIYIYQFVAGKYSIRKKIVLIR